MGFDLANLWRFPFIAISNGGGLAFLFPYLFVILFVGRPIYFLEMTLGQFSSNGPIKVWAASPFFKGIGYIGMLAAAIAVSYFSTVVATAIYYLAVSFQVTLPWTKCDPEWTDCFNCTVSNCAEMYYSRVVTQQKSNIDDGIGPPLLNLMICLAVVWSLVFISLKEYSYGSRKFAKFFSYFTTYFPYVVLSIFLIRGLSLEGSSDGIRYFFAPAWQRILGADIWFAALAQCFFSLGTGSGTITMLSSKKNFRYNAYRDATKASLIDTFNSFLAGFTVFSFLGNVAYIMGTSIENQSIEGQGLIFVAFPFAISKFAWAPQLFAVLLFLMLITIGISSTNTLVNILLSILLEHFPAVKKWQMRLGCCIIGFVSGLLYITPGGQFMVTFMDYYGAGFLLYFICMVEVIAIAWIYGMNKYIRDVEFMLGRRLRWYWRACWGAIVPIGLATILIYTIASTGALTHEGLDFPEYAHAIGWTLVGISVSLLPVWGFYTVSKANGTTFLERLKNSFVPKATWGPCEFKDRAAWGLFQSIEDLNFPGSESDVVNLTVRGLKERVLVTRGSNTITVQVNNLAPDANVKHEPSCVGFNGIIHKMLGKNQQTWIIYEAGFEFFRIVVEVRESVIFKVITQQFNSEYIVSIKF